jgi:predicted DNA-binding transcriptional regulator YafY
MKSDRLLTALMLLQARGRVTERELAERLEVSQRTVHRDMEALSAARVPLSAIRGSQGGWELEKGWRTQVPGLNEGELRALLMAQPRSLGQSRLAAAAESALNKLMAALPGPMQAQAAAMRERLHVDPTGWRGTGEDLSMLGAVQEAVSADRKLAFDYTRNDGQTAPRTVDPLGMVAKGLTWYLVARGANGIRTYRVSRMAGVTVLTATFVRPAKFDLAEYWKASTKSLKEKCDGFEVTLCLTREAVRQLTEWRMAELSASDEESGDEPEPPQGWVRMRARFDGEREALFVVLGLATAARVLAPAAFRTCVLDEARRVAAL